MSPPRPPAPPHHPERWFENEEKTRTLTEISERLTKIGSGLRTSGKVRLGRTEVRPPRECLFIIRYEQMPRGELSLKLELQWEGRVASGDERPTEAADLEIE